MISGLFKKIKSFAVKSSDKYANTSLQPEPVDIERSNMEITKFDPSKCINESIL